MNYDTKRLRVFEYEGYTILVGKSDVDNDYLTFEVAKPTDTWYHVHGYAGAHVVLVRKHEGLFLKREVTTPVRVAQYAISLAHQYSKAKDVPSVEVSVCLVQQVRKDSDSPDGQVIVTGKRNYTVSELNKYG